jgi:hypothetical protein
VNSNSEQPARRAGKRSRKKPQLKRFRPTAAMQRFLRVEMEFLAKRRPYTQKQIAEGAAVSEFQASRWHDVAGYDDWMIDELRRVATRLFARGTVAAGYRVILTGDPKELETFGRVMGLLDLRHADSLGSDLGGGGCIINLLVPRPEYPQGAVVAAPTLRLPPPDLPPSAVGSQR